MNKMLNAMKEAQNFTYTENGAITHESTLNALMDMFALGGSYRSRSDDDCILLFKNAYAEDPVYALRCLYYLRDCRGGQGERRFFRVVINWLAKKNPEAVRRNLKYIVEMGRWDDLYALVNTPLEAEVFDFMYHQLALDVECKTPSLLAKWLKSENASSAESHHLAIKTRKAFNMTAKQYRKTLAILRERIRVLERLMSENRWDEIEYDKIPGKAGLRYRNAFARHDIERMKANKQTYADFAKDENTTVNADTLNPCDVTHEVIKNCYSPYLKPDDTQRLIINKYWDNLKDYIHNAVFDGVAVVDTSASMLSGADRGICPMDVAIALGMYCAEKCNPESPWYGNYISFSNKAKLIPIVGVDFYDKVRRIYKQNLCQNTNIESVFNLMLTLAKENNLSQEDLPKNIIIISDMEFDMARTRHDRFSTAETLMEGIVQLWKLHGYTSPHLVFWNVDARQNNIPMRDTGNVTFISGYSAVLFEQLMTGKKGIDLVLDKLNSKRYAGIN